MPALIPPGVDEIFTVTGLPGPASSTRTSVQVVLSNSNGGSEHQPWLRTVRGKLNSLGVGIAMLMAKPGFGRDSIKLTAQSRFQARSNRWRKIC